ncbi:sugar phosphate isomerase/epimerase family protein [Echinicola vietnamensis]|nr:sugar phosphate isomerase/epimerase family protein [Echinicola vietnamensis]
MAATPVSTKEKNMKKAKIAVITWTYGIDDLETLFAKIKETGFEAVQFSGNYRVHRANDVVATAQKYDIEILSYDPMSFKPFDDEKLTLKDAVKHYSDVIEYAKAIGAPMATLQGLSYWTKEISDYEKAIQFIIEAVRQLDKVAQNLNITLTYEACNQYEIPWVQTADELLRIHSESNAKKLLLVLDSFHMNICETDMLSPLRKIGKLLHSYHVSDSGRSGIGSGHIDYVAQYKVLQEIGFDGYVFFEFVLPEIRPYKLPMNEKQMEKSIQQNKYSIQLWNAIAESSIK